jgi:iron complex transport system substrate-binding protein
MLGPVTDASGVVFTAPVPPKRIVSLIPSVTETLFALGLGESLVGVTTF